MPEQIKMIRIGLCCIFKNEPIRFRRSTASNLGKFTRPEQLDRLSDICLHNSEALLSSLCFCEKNGIGCFRVNSQILPLKTHPDIGYDLEDLPGGQHIRKKFLDCGEFARKHDIRVTFHPDQFILLSSPRTSVTAKSLSELSYQADMAELITADVINIHGGGMYGDKQAALKRLVRQIRRLPEPIRTRLTLENDDRIYTPADLIPVCRKTGIPFVYDIHHHRCLPDGLTFEETTRAALSTWNREPLFHVSSPKGEMGEARKHHDYVHIDDFPECWRDIEVTVEVEAKAKELAVLKLRRELQEKWDIRFRPTATEN